MAPHSVSVTGPRPPSRMTRPLTGLAMLLVLAGCTTASRSTSDAFRLLLHRQVSVSAEQVAANRFPQAQLKAPDLDAVIVLGYVDDGHQTWYAGNHAVFRLDSNGLLLGTTGLGRDLQARILGDSPFDHLADVTAPVQVQREYDWRPRYQFGVKVTGTLSRAGMETVDVLGRPLQLARFEEVLQGGGMKARNLYWADPSTGFIWKSRQSLAPGYVVELLQLKPYRKARN